MTSYNCYIYGADSLHDVHHDAHHVQIIKRKTKYTTQSEHRKIVERDKIDTTIHMTSDRSDTTIHMTADRSLSWQSEPEFVFYTEKVILSLKVLLY